MSFFDQQLDPQISYGAEIIPFYVTMVMTTPARVEARQQQASRAFRRIKCDLAGKSVAQLQALQQFFYMTQGMTNGFLAKDWTDYKANGEAITCINVSSIFTAQLQKTYSNYGRTETRPITKPIAGFTLTRDGIAFPSSGNWSVDNYGLITFTADQTAHTLTWSGQFNTPVRLNSDEMDSVYEDFDITSWKGLELMEITVRCTDGVYR